MTRDEFEIALDRYGPDLTRWPESLRTQAADLMRADRQAAALFADAERLAKTLAEAVRPEPIGAPLAGRILAAAGDPHRNRVVPFRATPRLAALVSLGLIAMIGIGFTAGYLLGPDDDDDSAVAAAVFAGEHAGTEL